MTSSNRWTGAAAPAFVEVEALRAAGVDAQFGYVGGYRLEKKIGGVPFVHEVIRKKQNPWTFHASVKAIGEVLDRGGFDLLHAHLSYDHWLARFLSRSRALSVVRTFHALRPLKERLATPVLLRHTDAVAVVNETFLNEAPLNGIPAMFTPPPVDHRQFHLDGPNVRQALGLEPATPVVGFIGKVSPGRGFEDGMVVFRHILNAVPSAKMMIIGRGPHRQALESLSRELGIESNVIWAGYHEEDLAEHYRSMNLMLFTCTGSDEGHRAVSEAMACGTPVISFPIRGVDSVFGGLSARLISETAIPASMAELAVSELRAGDADLRLSCAEETRRFGLAATAERLAELYERALSGRRRSQ